MRLARCGAIVAAACALAVSAPGCGPPCASQPAACHPSPLARDELVCFHEAPTGSHIAETRCYKRSEIDERRKADRAMMENAQIQSTRVRGTRGP
jgi:hypothetical protein